MYRTAAHTEKVLAEVDKWWGMALGRAGVFSVLVDCQPDQMCVNIPTELEEFQFEDCFRKKRQKLCHHINGCGTTFDYLVCINSN